MISGIYICNRNWLGHITADYRSQQLCNQQQRRRCVNINSRHWQLNRTLQQHNKTCLHCAILNVNKTVFYSYKTS